MEIICLRSASVVLKEFAVLAITGLLVKKLPLFSLLSCCKSFANFNMV